jgi:VanZ family protein
MSHPEVTESGLKARNVWVVIGAAFVLLVIYLSLTPRPLDVPSVYDLKTGHILAYAWLMFWFSQIYRRPAQRVVLGAAFLALGVALEYIQGWVGRDFAYTDMRDDGIGIAIGAALAATPLGGALAIIERWLNA